MMVTQINSVLFESRVNLGGIICDVVTSPFSEDEAYQTQLIEPLNKLVLNTICSEPKSSAVLVHGYFEAVAHRPDGNYNLAVVEVQKSLDCRRVNAHLMEALRLDNLVNDLRGKLRIGERVRSSYQRLIETRSEE